MNELHLSLIALLLASTLGASSLQAQSRPDAAGLRPAQPIACSGNDDVVLRGRVIETAGVAIQVHGNCDVEIIDSHIVAGGVAVLVQGNGDAVLSGSYVEGEQAALVAEGNGEIRYRETTLRGDTYTGGRGEIAGDDGMIHQSRGVLSGLGNVRIGRGGIQVDDGTGTISIGAGGVVVDDGRETVSVRPGEDGLRVEAGDVALVLDADVTVDGDLLRLGVGASVEISDDWRHAGHSPYRAADTDRLLIELGARDDGGELRLALTGDVLFDLDSAAIKPPGATELRKLAHVLRQRAGEEIRVVGHTDSLGSDDHNLKLSRARAVAVMRWLSDNEDIPTRLMVGQGMAAKQPIAHNTMPDGSDNPQGRARNRRVEVFLAARN